VTGDREGERGPQRRRAPIRAVALLVLVSLVGWAPESFGSTVAASGLTRGSALLSEPERVATLAAELGTDPDDLAALLADPSIMVNGSLLAYADPVEPDPITAEAVEPPSPAFPLDQTFLLHSRPASTHVIYLDFDGYDFATGESLWGIDDSGPFSALAYSADGDATSFSDAERTTIQSVWEAVSEDFAAFDIDVTTQDPGIAAILRSGPSDTAYGMRVVIGATNATSVCGSLCGGIAYIGVFDTVDGYYSASPQPAWVFTKTDSTWKFMAEAAAHEVGHTLGLFHDGSTTNAYFAGNTIWAPIMGVGYYAPVTQWSKGEYSNYVLGDAPSVQALKSSPSTRTFDDLAVIQSFGAPAIPDDHSDDTTGATVITAGSTVSGLIGVVATGTDSDYFVLTPGADGTVTIAVDPATTAASLDVNLEIGRFIEGYSVVASDNPTATTSSTNVAVGLSASVTIDVLAGESYYIDVSPSGVGTADTGYTTYASMGRYTLTISDLLEPPYEPTGLSATPGNARASLVWTAPADDGGATITSYTVEYSSDGGLNWASIATGSATSSRTVTGLVNGTDYTFRVSATTSIGTGLPSAEANATPRTTPTAPGAPTPTAGNAKVTLSWGAPSSTGGADISRYRVQYSTDSVTWTTATTSAPLSRTYTVTGLTNGQGYWFRIAAINVAGTGTNSASTWAKPATKPSAPRSFSAARAGSQTVRLTWLAPSSAGGAKIQSYVIQRSTDGIVWSGVASVGPTVRAWTVGGLVNGRTYRFRIAAVNVMGRGTWASTSIIPRA
jgi:hypothetical protein